MPSATSLPNRVSIVLMSAIGDVTLGLPVATALKRAKPGMHITWVAQPAAAQLLDDHPAVNRVVRFDRSGGLAAYQRVREQLHTEPPADVLLDLQVALKAGLVTAVAPAREKWGLDRHRTLDANWLFTNRKVPARPRQHMADQFLEFLAPFGVNPEPVDYGLSPSPAASEWQRQAVQAFNRPYAVCVIASSAMHKNWFADRWAAVCDTLHTTYGLHPVLAGGDTPYERETAAAITAATSAPVTNLLGSGIPNLLALLHHAAVVISPDTGPMHLGIALGRPVIAMYGSTNPKWVGPYRRCHDLLIDRYGDAGEDYPITMARREGRMERVTVDDVRAKLSLWASSR